MRRLASVPLSIVFLIAFAAPIAAFVHYGWFNTSAIDTNSDGHADLSVCYDVSLSSPIYINRGDIDQEIEQWHVASFGAFSSNAVCNNDGSNIKILQLNNGPCEPSTGGILAETDDLGNTGYSSIRIWFNPNCMDDFDWYDADGIDTGKWTALGVATHEVGHALGMNHSNTGTAIMNHGGPNNCFEFWEHDVKKLAEDDALAYRLRYPGISDTSTNFGSAVQCEE